VDTLVQLDFRIKENSQALMVPGVDGEFDFLYLQFEKVRVDENGSNMVFIVPLKLNQPERQRITSADLCK